MWAVKESWEQIIRQINMLHSIIILMRLYIWMDCVWLWWIRCGYCISLGEIYGYETDSPLLI